MKGLTHYIVGVAIATFFIDAVQMTIFDKSWILLLGGVFGILPDFMDFRFARYLIVHDYEVTPGHKDLNPRVVSETVAKAIDEAAEKSKSIKIKLHSMKVSRDFWRQYSVQFDTDKKEIITKIGPLVTTGQVPQPGTAPKGDKAIAVAKYKADINHTYHLATNIDIWHGNDWEFVPEGDKIRVDFIPWHRKVWHSFTAGLLFGPIGFLIYGDWSAMMSGDVLGFFTAQAGWLAALIIVLGFWGHVVCDQLGNLGSNLFYPFTKKRARGLKMTSASDPFSNISFVYASIALIIFNFNAFNYRHSFMMWGIDNFHGVNYFIGLAEYFVLVIILPMVLLKLAIIGYKKKFIEPRKKKEEELSNEEKEALDSLAEITEMAGG